jgi:hypothetical protein
MRWAILHPLSGLNKREKRSRPVASINATGGLEASVSTGGQVRDDYKVMVRGTKKLEAY